MSSGAPTLARKMENEPGRARPGREREDIGEWEACRYSVLSSNQEGTRERRCTASYSAARPSTATCHLAQGSKEGGPGEGSREWAAAAQEATSTWWPSKGAAARRAAVRYGGARRPLAGAGQKAGLTGGQTAFGRSRGRSDLPCGAVRPLVTAQLGENKGEG